MHKILYQWYQRYFSDPGAVALVMSLFVIFALFYTMGSMLAPVIASVIIAYLLDWPVGAIERWRVPHILSVLIVYALFLGVVMIILLGLLPLLIQQLTSLLNEVPNMVTKGQSLLTLLQDRYPDYLNAEQVSQYMADIKTALLKFGQLVLSWSLASIPSLIEIIIYLVLVPLLIYFFLMDKLQLLNWFARFLPRERGLLKRVAEEMDIQIGNYVRGKMFEGLVVFFATYVAFLFLGLNYALLLSFLVGLSVFIPYIGAVIVTIPIVIVAAFQWGMGSQFVYAMIVYAILTALDGQILVPVLFSGRLKLHPIAIIVAILVFGGWWGFWGIFFAIPLASLVKAVIAAWPLQGDSQSETPKKKRPPRPQKPKPQTA